LYLVFVYTQKAPARKNFLDAYLRKSVVNSKAVNSRRKFLRIIFYFLNLFYSCCSKEACILKERFPSIPVIPSSFKETHGFFEKIFQVGNFCDLHTDLAQKFT